MTTIPIDPPPAAATFETTAPIIQRHGGYEDCDTEPDWVHRSKAHCQLMAPMSSDKRIDYLRTAGCEEDKIQVIIRAIATSLGKTAKRSLRTGALQCAEAKSDIEKLLDQWPERQHFQLLNTELDVLNDEQISLAKAYTACHIYEAAATALYLAIIDNMPAVEDNVLNTPENRTRDQSIADSGYDDEVAQWPK